MVRSPVVSPAEFLKKSFMIWQLTKELRFFVQDREKCVVVFLFLTALSLRLLNLYLMYTNDPFYMKFRLDHARYDEWAMLILRDGLMGDHAFYQDPLYPYLLAFLYSIVGHNYIFVFVLQSIMGAVSCILVYLIGKMLFSKRVATLASLFFAFYGPSIFYADMLTKEAVSTLLFLASVYSLLRWKQDTKIYRLILSGLFLGMAVMTRGNFSVLVPLYLVFVFVTGSDLYRQKALFCGLMLSGFSLAILPSTIHNYIVEKDFILVTSQGGQNFYLGNNPLSTGTYTNLAFVRPNPKYERIDFEREAIRRTGKRMSPSEISRFWYGEAFEFILNKPDRFLQLLWKKTGLFFNYFEVPDNRDYQFKRQYSHVLRYNPFVFALMGPLALTGVLISLRDWRRHWFLSSVVFVYAVGVISFLVLSRFRIQMVPLILLFAAYFIFEVKDRLTQRQYRRLFIYTLLFLLFTFYTNRHIHDTEFYRYHSRVDLGGNYMEIGEYDRAIQELTAALPIKPKDGRADILLAESYQNIAKVEKAKQVLQNYLAHNPGDASALRKLLELEMAR
jgi:4-amino-4-deoxy-L-arabinose transferase-like glycosyltransferase